MTAHPEHALQVKLTAWVRDCVGLPHEFFGFDRSQARSQFTHAREKARGIQAGTPDTLLMVAGFPDIWVELKSFGKKPDPYGTQMRLGARINSLGRIWNWCDTVDSYRRILRAIGVPLAPDAELRAMQMDAVLQRPAAEKHLAKRVARQVRVRPTPAQVARAERARRLPV